MNQDAPLHHKARQWLQAAISGTEVLGLSWNVILAFLRLTTRPGFFRHPLPLEFAFGLLESWLEQPIIAVIEPGPRHLQILRGLLTPVGSGGNLTSDTHLAALALEHEAELCSTDSDFARFQRLRWRNPL